MFLIYCTSHQIVQEITSQAFLRAMRIHGNPLKTSRSDMGRLIYRGIKECPVNNYARDIRRARKGLLCIELTY